MIGKPSQTTNTHGSACLIAPKLHHRPLLNILDGDEEDAFDAK